MLLGPQLGSTASQMLQVAKSDHKWTAVCRVSRGNGDDERVPEFAEGHSHPFSRLLVNDDVVRSNPFLSSRRQPAECHKREGLSFICVSSAKQTVMLLLSHPCHGVLLRRLSGRFIINPSSRLGADRRGHDAAFNTSYQSSIRTRSRSSLVYYTDVRIVSYEGNLARSVTEFGRVQRRNAVVRRTLAYFEYDPSGY